MPWYRRRGYTPCGNPSLPTSAQQPRITSYNVCYTKLLRFEKNAGFAFFTDTLIKPGIYLRNGLWFSLEDIFRADFEEIIVEPKMAADSLFYPEKIQIAAMLPYFLHQAQEVIRTGHVDEIHSFGNDQQIFLFRRLLTNSLQFFTDMIDRAEIERTSYNFV